MSQSDEMLTAATSDALAAPKKRKGPAFQLYGSDVIAQESFTFASLAERGLFFTLLMHCWHNGDIPADYTKLARLTGLTEADIDSAWGEIVEQEFKPRRERPDRLYSEELDRQRFEHRMLHDRKSAGGRKGGLRTQEGNRRDRNSASSSDPSIPSSHAEGAEKRRVEKSREEKNGKEVLHRVNSSGEEKDEWRRTAFPDDDEGVPISPA